MSLEFKIITNTITPLIDDLYQHALIARNNNMYILYGTIDLSKMWIEKIDTNLHLYQITDEIEFNEIARFCYENNLITMRVNKEIKISDAIQGI